MLGALAGVVDCLMVLLEEVDVWLLGTAACKSVVGEAAEVCGSVVAVDVLADPATLVDEEVGAGVTAGRVV
jgi:hypothetical protein